MSHRRELVDYLKLHGRSETEQLVDLVQKVLWDDLREEFIRCLTVDSETRDHRRKDFNDAIFDPEHGFATFTNTDLGMVLAKYDQAVRRTRAQR